MIDYNDEGIGKEVTSGFNLQQNNNSIHDYYRVKYQRASEASSPRVDNNAEPARLYIKIQISFTPRQCRHPRDE